MPDAAASGHVGNVPWTGADGASSSSWGTSQEWNGAVSDQRWNGWNSRQRQSKAKDTPDHEHTGQYDHRGPPAEDKGMGMYAHDKRMKRYEERQDGDLSSTTSEDDDAERSD